MVVSMKVMMLFACIVSSSLFSSKVAALDVLSNQKTSPSTMIENGWHCVDNELQEVPTYTRFTEEKYHYLEARSIYLGASAAHVVCELGQPDVNIVVSKSLKVVGFFKESDEQLLIYGTDVSSSSANESVLIVFVPASGLVRRMIWVTPESQSLVGFQIVPSSRKFEKFKGNYKLDVDDVFHK